MNKEEKIKELEAKVKELEEKNNTNATDIIAINHIMNRMLEGIENNTALIEKIIRIIINN